MTQEDYVSYETAQLLREKGFDGECMSMYVTPKPHSGMGNPNEAKIAPHGRDGHYYDGYTYQCEVPTLQMVVKWIRKKGFHIFVPLEIDYDEDERGCKWYHDATYYPEIRRISDGKIMYDDGRLYAEPEQACEAAIKYCLENLI